MKINPVILSGSVILFAAAVHVACFVAIAAEPATPAYPDHSRLMVYVDDAGQEHPVSSRDDWAVRRRHILAGMEQAMGPLPDRTKLVPLDVQVTETAHDNGVDRLTISFAAEERDRVPAHLYLPEGRPEGQRLPAMLALHPTGPLGKAIVAGLGPRANRAYGLELAQRGYVVLAPDYPSFGDYKYEFHGGGYVSGTMKGIFNHMRCVDLLQSREDVDPERIGVIGHSLGGHNALFVAVFDERLKVTVSSCGWTPFHDYRQGRLAPWAQDCYMPRLRDAYELAPDRVPFDFYEVLAALSPRAFFSCSPLRDDNFSVEGVKKAVPRVAEVYQLFDAADRLQMHYPDCEHDFPDDMRREAYEFVDRILEHTPTAAIPKSEDRGR